MSKGRSGQRLFSFSLHFADALFLCSPLAAYSLKVKDSRTKKTLGKAKLDLRQYCKLESQFNRAFVELEATGGVKIFLVISTELVDEDNAESGVSTPQAQSPLDDSDTRT